MAGFPHLSEALPQLALPAEVAPLLHATPDAVTRMCRNGQIPAVKVAGRWLVHVKRLAELIDQTAVIPAESRLDTDRP